ncbi:hypothetical protein WL88_23630 [Burkholderia diffusa]|uniref:Uncharacterized protein n=1 Tax=Burkholderia diffusa TaxID=488732 RepID=A0AAW3PAM3_9BURK|nr:hypothetical protein WI28_06835 [Burkholderia diffusa]KVC23666.1 hypothetical protein WI69_02975 [Burkholderia diffusa]KVH46801.1 hypothetical protein WJ39_16065 [Burkholderia diffusa]KWF30161.1 hypothetical protein WL85_24255 [Burkholderia diffusa]KWF39039.1 hypothetical protein WL86_17050 [Burkholderia diffusa]
MIVYSGIESTESLSHRKLPLSGDKTSRPRAHVAGIAAACTHAVARARRDAHADAGAAQPS